ncbi:TM2 domain-containing protein [Sphingomonas sp. MA1305]|uniref:TM2 domain-containing protein n=1 Tax=Sphingomonas sp. MA1305 TaxID=2479204 RepID=UPI001E2FA81B|nr:TM2 domain-containing protein [Sphingomonas sp. MA1305]
MMQGRVLGVDVRTGEGLVAGDDGRRYRFSQQDWATRGEPAIGMTVDFDVDQDRALSVFPLPGEQRGVTTLPPRPRPPEADRSKIVAALLALFLGTLGIHRFYLGRTGSGIAMLVVSLTVIGLFVTGIWAFVDAIRYLLMSNREFAARYARSD